MSTRNSRRVLLISGLLLASCPTSIATPQVRLPQVEGPIPVNEQSYPMMAVDRLLFPAVRSLSSGRRGSGESG